MAASLVCGREKPLHCRCVGAAVPAPAPGADGGARGFVQEELSAMCSKITQICQPLGLAEKVICEHG